MPEPGKNAPGLTGFPTPNEEDTEGYLLFILPKSNDFSGLILGAVDVLANPYNYYQWGDFTDDEAAYAMRQIIEQAPLNKLPISVPAPYWDTSEDSDDDLPRDEQIWYGHMEGETFIERVEDFALAGFLAYAGNVGAALTFLTIAPKFRLAWKTGDIGGIIRIFIDSADAGTVNTFSAEPGVIERDFVGDLSLDTHCILMVLESI